MQKQKLWVILDPYGKPIKDTFSVVEQEAWARFNRHIVGPDKSKFKATAVQGEFIWDKKEEKCQTKSS